MTCAGGARRNPNPNPIPIPNPNPNPIPNPNHHPNPNLSRWLRGRGEASRLVAHRDTYVTRHDFEEVRGRVRVRVSDAYVTRHDFEEVRGRVRVKG